MNKEFSNDALALMIIQFTKIFIASLVISFLVVGGVHWYENTNKLVDELYPKIALDFHGADMEKIAEKFGEPEEEKLEATGFIDGGFWSKDHWYHYYVFDDGVIAFYVHKETGSNDYTEIILGKQSQIKIPIPGLKVILGVSTFGDIFDLVNEHNGKRGKIISREGGSAQNHYTNATFFFGDRKFIFGIPGFFDEKADRDHRVLSDKKPRRVLIKSRF